MATPVPILTAVELALADRLRRGLGRMVNAVETYGGEFDDENLLEVLKRFPAAWVTFAGVKKTVPVDTRREKWRAEGSFVVMVGTRSVRSESASRLGGPGAREVGTNLLVYAVRHLLAQQDLGLPIRALEPGSVRTLYNSRIQGQAFSVFALEFHTAWVEATLPLGTFPQPVDPASVDAGDPTSGLDSLFARFGGQVDPATPQWNTLVMNYYLNPSQEAGAPDAQDVVSLTGATE
ncbi:DUF1834 family protein [Paludibacterium yongneupense]|uniref:DUF1834 family protein n=1 Tax=Paludibacterium yongneupense TaxID=400061 RepID=UPI000420E55F|nr:DUF1834 family protein [Paludibacterium yongneupense]